MSYPTHRKYISNYKKFYPKKKTQFLKIQLLPFLNRDVEISTISKSVYVGRLLTVTPPFLKLRLKTGKLILIRVATIEEIHETGEKNEDKAD